MVNLVATEYEIFGEDLWKAREEAGLTQAQLANQIGVSQPYICELEHPGRHRINAMIAESLKKIFST